MFTDPHSEPPSVINRGPDQGPVSSALPLLDCSEPDCLLRLSGVLERGAPVETMIKWPICFRGRRRGGGGIATGLLEKLEEVGYLTCSLSLFVRRISAPAACLKIATFFIQ